MNQNSRSQLINALLECPSISDPDRREAIIAELPDDIKHNLKPKTSDKFDVADLLKICLNYPSGLQTLLDTLEFYEGASSLALQAVKRYAAPLLNPQTETGTNEGQGPLINNYPPPPPLPQPTADTPTPATPLPENPYRGLFAFRPEHAPLFFGRERFSQQVVKAVEAQPLTAVLGASGSGKSSLVFAGLVPHLLQQGPDKWLFTTFRPGADPFQGLASALVPLYEGAMSKTEQMLTVRTVSKALSSGELPLADVINTIAETSPTQRLLIIADQFEELYTLCRDPQTRQRFLDLLLALLAGTQGDSPRLVLTLRADFLGQASLYRPFADALQGHSELLGPMTRLEMTAAIEKPAALRGVGLETQLTASILDDIGSTEEGSLPLLEFALDELWQQQQQQTLTHQAYQEIGGIKGALSRHADKIYQHLSPSEQKQARRVLVQLVNPGAGTEDTRRLALRAELAQDWPLVTKLANERLVVTNTHTVNNTIDSNAQNDKGKGKENKAANDSKTNSPVKQDTVEVVHEALIRHWGLLQSWMDEDRTFRAWQDRFRFSLRQWQTVHDDDSLLRGHQLAEAEGWLLERTDELGQAEQSYIKAGLKQQRTQAQRRRLAFMAVTLTAVVMTILTIFSIYQLQVAQDAKNEAEAAKSATQAELDFAQTIDPTARLEALTILLNFERADVVTRLFWELPRREEQLKLLTTENDKLEPVIKTLYTSLADVNRTGYTDELLSAMIEGLTINQQEGDLKAELEQWQHARTFVRAEQYEQARTAYDTLLGLNQTNLATQYERAAVLLKLEDYQAAITDLDQVMALLKPQALVTSGLLESGAEFATVAQVKQAVRRLIKLTPALGAMLNEDPATYPHLKQFGLILAPTPTPITHKFAGITTTMVLVPAGFFTMGSNVSSNEQPVHEVYLPDFYIDQYEVTNAQYAQFLNKNEQGNHEEEDTTWLDADSEDVRIQQQQGQWVAADDFDKHPVVEVNWYGAKAYCAWRGARLPTEAEWEKAARGTDARTYPFGQQVAPPMARYYTGAELGTVPVGSYPEGVSPYGVHDMAGNVWEWVSSEYRDYPYQADDGREDIENSEKETLFRVLRGGSWDNIDYNLRTAYRNFLQASSRYDDFGFRCAR